MKLLIVATNRERGINVVAPLGALCVAASARFAGHDVHFLDLGFESSPREALRNKLTGGGFQAVAFSIRNLDNCYVLTPKVFFGEVCELAKVVREVFKGPLILGGSGFSVSPRGWMRRVQADCGVIGEGEQVFIELLARLEAGQSLNGLHGVIIAESIDAADACVPAKAIEQLGAFPLPAHEFCQYKKYLRMGGWVSVQTKRGCAFHCIYCNYPHIEGSRYRLRPPEAVVDEIEMVVRDPKIRYFYFVDSVFNYPRENALLICAEMGRRKLPVKWMAGCTPLGFDAEMAKAMLQAGCIGVEFTFDGATPKMLAALQKPFGQDEIQIATQAAYDAGLPFASCLLFGGPGETWVDVEEAQTFLNSCAPSNIVLASFGIRIYEGTKMVTIATEEGVISPGQDLFDPVYYISPGLAENCMEKLDRIVRRRPEWSSPMDWERPLTLWINKLLFLLDVRPSWVNSRMYGLYLRKKIAD
jgi:radical SAM superfamily enzyme YgiQ (UPF0313 family)